MILVKICHIELKFWLVLVLYGAFFCMGNPKKWSKDDLPTPRFQVLRILLAMLLKSNSRLKSKYHIFIFMFFRMKTKKAANVYFTENERFFGIIRKSYSLKSKCLKIEVSTFIPNRCLSLQKRHQKAGK
jgi:hypothetical protein